MRTRPQPLPHKPQEHTDAKEFHPTGVGYRGVLEADSHAPAAVQTHLSGRKVRCVRAEAHVRRGPVVNSGKIVDVY